MESLHDRFFSDINKNHIFNLVCNLIQTNYNDTSIRTNEYFKQTYEKNMTESFEQIDTDDIVVLNRKLLDSQLQSYQSSHLNSLNETNNPQSKREVHQEENTRQEDDEPRLREATNIPLVLHGINKNLQEDSSLYTLAFETNPQIIFLGSIILSHETNLIFANPMIIISINETDILCKMDSIKEIGKRKYLEFIPLVREYLDVTTNISIEIKNICGETYHKKDKLRMEEVPPQNRDKQEIFIKDNTCRVGDVLKIDSELYSIREIPQQRRERICLEDGDRTILNKESYVVNVSEQPSFVFYSVSNS